MIQQVMTAPGVIEFREVETPEPGEGQVLVKMMRMGICGSDIHVYHGEHPYTSYPVTQGHEVSGEIVKIGPGVEHLKEGQKVTMEPQVFCGQCYPCTHGKYNDCDNLKVMGFQTTGAASEYFAVDASKIDVLPEGMSFDEGAMIEPLAVTIHAAKRYPDIQGANVCVLGCGPIGILVAQSCKALGAAKVMVTDVSDYRLEMAKAVGADYAVNTREHDFGAALTDCFGSDKADVIYDCAGNDITMNQAIQNCRKGGTIILVAVFAGEAHIDLAKLNDSELDLNTSFMYTHEDYVDAIRLVGEGKIKLAPLMSKHFAFNEFTEAYRYIDDNREQTMKVIIDIQN
ncbi:MAG: alcohol dehydrogenase catalytic domain-containing protein [Hungatella hathewayi]|nr:alcohol dehydrogenase catalytic domain-containing protein [Hungatella hathewayi]